MNWVVTTAVDEIEDLFPESLPIDTIIRDVSHTTLFIVTTNSEIYNSEINWTQKYTC
jgi:hypothetical protein